MISSWFFLDILFSIHFLIRKMPEKKDERNLENGKTNSSTGNDSDVIRQKRLNLDLI